MTYIYSPKHPRSKFEYLIKEIQDFEKRKKVSSYLDYLAKETLAYNILEVIENKYKNRSKDLTKDELVDLCHNLSIKIGNKKIDGTEFLVILLGLKTSRLPKKGQIVDFLIEHGGLKMPSIIKKSFTFKEAFAIFNIPSISRFNKAWEEVMRILFKDKLKKYPDFKIVQMLDKKDYGVGKKVSGIRIGKCDDTLMYSDFQFLVEYKGTVEGNQGRIIKDRVISEATALLKHSLNQKRYYIAIISGPGLNKNLAEEIKEAMKNKRFFLAGATKLDAKNLKIYTIDEMLSKIKDKLKP